MVEPELTWQKSFGPNLVGDEIITIFFLSGIGIENEITKASF